MTEWRERLATEARLARSVVSGPIVLTLAILVVEALARTSWAMPNPTAILLLAVAYSSFYDEAWRAYLTSFLAVGYTAVYFSQPGALLAFAPDDAYRVVVMVLVAPTMAVMGVLLKRRQVELAVEQAARVAAERERDFARRLVEGSPVALALARADGRITYVNAPAADLLGVPALDATARPWREACGGAEAVDALVGDALRSGARAARAAIPLTTRAGRAIVVDAVAAPTDDPSEAIVALVDATERHAAERDAADARRHALQSEKMAALGTLVSGVAHEVRSPLTAAQNHLQLLADRLSRQEQEEVVREHLAGIQDALDRVNHLVVELRRFSRMEVGVRARESLRRSVDEALRFFDTVQQGKIVVQARLEETPSIDLDPAQIQQVVLNLLENAAAASAQGGTVEVEVRAEAGDAVLRVRDQGVGMSSEVLARAFEPFYTTKPDGTGLGLSIARRIVEAHHARLECQSTPGQGTTFTVRFPIPSTRLVPSGPTAALTPPRGAAGP